MRPGHWPPPRCGRRCSKRSRPARGAARAAAMSGRVGLGFDVHPFSDDTTRSLVLGGVTLPGPGLAGHSDADVVAHAISDALLGAAGLGDIGHHFPDTDPAFAGADSVELLERVVALLASHGWGPVNVDCTVILEMPKLAPHREAMEGRLAAAIGAPGDGKAKRAGGRGGPGRREGIACHAVALVALVDGL